jgi:hypothetical protein
MFRTDLVPVDRCSGERRASSGEVKRLGDAPIVLEFLSDDATIEVAAKGDHRILAIGPLSTPSTPTPSPG